ncbi:MAG: hypothetical protein Q9160_000635 [Pyrenula sp. 1 TL-2023]
MSQPNHPIPEGDDVETGDVSIGYSDTEESAPEVKVKTPLNEQYQALEQQQQQQSGSAAQGTETGIDWIPDLEQYLKLVDKRFQKGLPCPAVIPHEFPAFVGGPACWSAKDIKMADIIHAFSNEQIDEIEKALAHFKGLNISKDALSPDTFPLPSLKSKLEAAAVEVHNGRGISIFRGLNPSKYSFEDGIMIYAGIASYIGEKRGTQDNDGNILVHIKDVGAAVAPDDQRQSPYANNAQPFHNDLGDIIAMCCVDRAETGGVSRVASAAKVYNVLASLRPDLISELASGSWIFDKHENVAASYERPILFYDKSGQRAFFCFSRRQLTGSSVSPRPAEFPALTEAQAEALDAVHFTADDHALEIQLEKGDMQFTNNFALLHAREAFKDGADRQKRHLIRMWLRNDKLAWETPKELEEPWKEIYGTARQPAWHMEPGHGTSHVINRSNSCHG